MVATAAMLETGLVASVIRAGSGQGYKLPRTGHVAAATRWRGRIGARVNDRCPPLLRRLSVAGVPQGGGRIWHAGLSLPSGDALFAKPLVLRGWTPGAGNRGLITIDEGAVRWFRIAGDAASPPMAGAVWRGG